MPPRFDTSVYTVGWVCASKDEVTASRAFLDEEHEQPPRRPNDNNVYIVGAMGEHKVVIAFPGAGSRGGTSAPDPKNPLNDIRLGDVVVIEPNGKHNFVLYLVHSGSHNNQGGVLQYDKGRWGEDGVFEIRSHLKRPPKDLLAAMNLLKSDHDRGMGKMIDYFEDISRNSSRLDYRLYKPSHPHTEGFDCSGCGTEHLETRLDRESDNPAVHYGLIASANAVMRSAVYRDHLRDTWGVCCFEMEAAGLMNYFPCLIVRGIADYSDNHKNDHWQRYAAAMAAAYAKDLLRVIPPEDVGSTEITSRTNEDCMSKWLNDFSYDLDKSFVFDEIHPGTGQWLLGSDEFQSWYQTRGQTLLCLGIPGAGKTVMAATIIEYINTHRHNDNLNHALGYVFFSFNFPSQKRTKNFVASILKQLAQQDRHLMQGLKALYGRHSVRGTQPSTHEIIDVLCSMSSDRQIYIVVDAVDEIQSLHKEPTEFLLELFRIQDATGLNILATSRFAPEIEKIFRERDDCSFLEIRATDEDIRRYVQGNITSLPSFVTQDQAMADRISKEIPRAASGMFLFARLCLDSLRDQVSPKRMHRALTEMSNNSGLRRLAYQETMKRIESQSPNLRNLAIHALSWIVCAKRPLSILELQHALAIQTGSHSIDTEDVADATLIISVCVGLVSVDMESGVVRLDHPTTQGFYSNFLEEWFPNAIGRLPKHVSHICPLTGL
ncbi:uncharacterized protein An08g04770 [Aspergillus niger]|uniref:Contig An08c0130, genomic contig n=2 Tax=Aspergillus niger TaxID=5061 RepID=A2QR49_ASPNC|nr:uncharacterized protein An08g04770 [Aspergillus niger]CAK45450.1 unnamed protein product [Aspergillus niger]